VLQGSSKNQNLKIKLHNLLIARDTAKVGTAPRDASPHCCLPAVDRLSSRVFTILSFMKILIHNSLLLLIGIPICWFNTHKNDF